MSASLKLAPMLSVPDDAVTQRLAFLGRIGSGKSYAATKLAELLYDAGAQFIYLDPVGIGYGLRVPGTGKALDIPVFGGLHGDVPLEASAGAMIADLVVDRGLSCVIDVSQFESDAEKARFAAAFAKRFFFRKKSAPSAVHIFLEECQEFIPQNPAKTDTMMLHEWTRLAKLGRNFGIGLSLISQRPQEVNKKVLNLTECLFAFQMTGSHERKAIRDWASDKGADEKLVEILPSLPVGDAHAWSPQWLQVSKRVKVYPKRTADVSSTPTLGGAARVDAKPLQAKDLEALRVAMAESVERAKADDPRELRKRIAELERAAKQTRVGDVDHATMVSQVEAAVASATRQHNAQMAELERRYGKQMELIAEHINDGLRHLEEANDIVHLVRKQGENPMQTLVLPKAEPDMRWRITPDMTAPPRKGSVIISKIEPVVSDTTLTPSDQKVLDALALMERIGAVPERVNLAFFAGYTVAGRFNNLVGNLNTRGYVSYPSPGTVALTDLGRKVARADGGEVQSRADLHALWIRKLPPSEGKVLQATLDCYPHSIAREALAFNTDYAVAGRFNNIVGKLKTLGALDYPKQGYVVASAALFPEGLK